MEDLTKDKLLRRLLKVVDRQEMDIILEDFYGIGNNVYEDFNKWLDENLEEKSY